MEGVLSPKKEAFSYVKYGSHIHLLINHVPILGSLFVLILFRVALVFKNGFLQKVSL